MLLLNANSQESNLNSHGFDLSPCVGMTAQRLSDAVSLFTCVQVHRHERNLIGRWHKIVLLLFSSLSILGKLFEIPCAWFLLCTLKVVTAPVLQSSGQMR